MVQRPPARPRPCRSAAATTAGSRCSGSSRPIPRWVAKSIDALQDSAYRLRALGTIAVSLCQVADARFDGMVSLRNSRGVDAAAGQLIVREAGGFVSFPRCAEPLAAPLDAEPSSPVVAARTVETLRALERIPT